MFACVPVVLHRPDLIPVVETVTAGGPGDRLKSRTIFYYRHIQAAGALCYFSDGYAKGLKAAIKIP